MVRLPVVISVFVCLAFHTSVISCQSTQGLLGLYTYLEMYILADSGILGSSEYPGNPGILRQRGRTSWDRPSIPGILGYSDSEVDGPRNILGSSKCPENLGILRQKGNCTGGSLEHPGIVRVSWKSLHTCTQGLCTGNPRNILGSSEYPGKPWDTQT